MLIGRSGHGRSHPPSITDDRLSSPGIQPVRAASQPAPRRSFAGTARATWKIVVQVKRYRNTVPSTAVRDLHGTVQDAGANKGVLVTTSGFGPGSHTFANGKPLELISGTELVDLLDRHGLRGRLGETARQAPAQPTPSGPDTRLPYDYNVLGMSWTGSVALDVCALVCRGNRVPSDDHVVFFNNPQRGWLRARPSSHRT